MEMTSRPSFHTCRSSGLGHSPSTICTMQPAAKLFFRKALKTQGRPHRVITLDGCAASHRAVRELPEKNEVWNNTKIGSSKYLNNIIEQDHRAIKAKIGTMLGFKRFRRA